MNSVDRLLDFFVPTNYHLDITIDGPNRAFAGTVTISGDTLSDTHPIKLHAKDLTITSATVDALDATISNGDNDEITLLTNTLDIGSHTVVVAFNGTITDHMHGLYPCYYEQDGVKKELFATQFESHHAREVFPCIDEPAAKATFDLTLTTARDQTVLANMPISQQQTVGKNVVTTFETTPRMSTYLLAFVIGDLHKKSAKTASGVDVSIWSTPVQPASSLDFALDIAVRTIEFYDEYFGTAYPLPKSDHVALPDFSSGAMENWGLVTYRETTLLADPRTTSISAKRYIATVIAHELAHQWFGNLVTMKWWNDLWLNESFATLMEYIAVDALEPQWNIWLDFATHESVAALRRDSIDGVQSVQVDVHHPDEISTLFDGAIVYAKGARLLRMIQNYVGNEAFRQGLKRYFADHAYGNTVGDDLWRALENASGKQVTAIMNTWISQPGYPVVSITRQDDTISLHQKQFFVGPHKPADRKWPIPLDADDASAPKLFDSTEITWESNRPIRLNVHDAAHFITQYDPLSLDALTTQIEKGTLDTVGRVQLLDEATLLARGGSMSSNELIPLLNAYQHETNDSVWDTIGAGLAELRKFIEDNTEAEQKLRRFSALLAREQYERLGWESIDGESEDDAKLRCNVIALTLYGEVPEAIEKAKAIYDSTPLEEINPELRSLIISSVARYGDGDIVDSLMSVYKKTQSGDLKTDICVGVTSTRIPEKISFLLESMKDSETIKPQDVFRWFIYLIRGRESRVLAWSWVRNNWEWIEATFKGDKSYDDFPRYSANGLMTRQQLQEYKDFFGPLSSVVSLSRTITMGISEIEGRVELIERDRDAVVETLLKLDV